MNKNVQLNKKLKFRKNENFLLINLLYICHLRMIEIF